jgi:hypothetical protein
MEIPREHLPPKERQLLHLIEERGRILTRIKERGNGDIESVQPPVVPGTGSAASRPIPLDDDEVLTCLHALEARGLVRSEATVFVASTTEYVCEWTLRASR